MFRYGVQKKAMSLPRLLLVDDETVLRRSMLRMVRGVFDMTAVESAEDALVQLENDREFVVLLLDIMMPGMDGIQLFHEIERRWPGLEARVVFVSGGSFGPEGPTPDLPNVFLPKPVSLAEIQREVAKWQT
jgi:CheY-like chemotaxis protein